MDQRTALILWEVNFLNLRRYEALKDQLPLSSRLLPSIDRALLQALGCKAEKAISILQQLQTIDPSLLEQEMIEHDIHLLTIEDDQYPSILREVPDAPIFLSYRGDLSALSQPLVALVGTRRMTPYGRRVTESFVDACTRNGMVTVSGLALGIDAAVAHDTIEDHGRTVAVLGSGLLEIAPRSNLDLAERIVTSGGLLLSEEPLHASPMPFSFPARNRIIAGLSMATVVLEAPVESGALITANLALDYNRDVFAVPGQIFSDLSSGCHHLIASGSAQIATDPYDVLRTLGCVPSPDQPPHFVPSTPEEEVIFRSLSRMPVLVDDLVLSTGLPLPTLTATLTTMELSGAILHLGGGQWVRK